MISYPCNRRTSGFSLGDLFIVIIVLAAFALFLWPALEASHKHEGRIRCVANLRQIGTALRSDDRQNPLLVALTNSETMRAVTHGQAYLLWQCLSNRLDSPTNLAISVLFRKTSGESTTMIAFAPS